MVGCATVLYELYELYEHVLMSVCTWHVHVVSDFVRHLVVFLRDVVEGAIAGR